MRRHLLLLVTMASALAWAGIGSAAAPTKVTVSASKPIVVSGQSVTLSGTTSSHQAGQTVTVMSEPSGSSSFTTLTTATTVAQGNWSTVVNPTITTAYEASWNGVTSSTVTVKVRPKLVLAVVNASTGTFSVSASPNAFSGKYVLIERLTSTGATVATHVTLNGGSSATFTVRLHHGRNRLRAVLPTSQAAPGYLTAMSNTVTVTR